MPPKGSRGRGRVKGGITYEGRTSPADLQAGDETSSSSGTLTSTFPIELQTNASMLASIAQQQDISSPNLSPVSAPTETPASTPVRAPVQRLDSLGVSGRGTMTTGRGTGRAMAGKFKPKAGRRGAEERAQAEAEERLRREERERAMQREQATSLGGLRHGRGDVSRGRGIWARGRGDAMGRGDARGRGDAKGRGGLDRNKGSQEATGVFGIAPAGSGVKPTTIHIAGETRQVSTGVSGGVSATRTTIVTSSLDTKATRVKRELDADESMHDLSDTPEIKQEIPEPIYPEEQDGNKPAPRIDIEQINLITDDEDDFPEVSAISKSKGKGRSLASRVGLKPVRLQRAEHKDRVTMVNTESAAASLADGKASYVEDITAPGVFTSQDDEGQEEERNDHDFYRDGKLWSGAWRDQEVQVKLDPEGAADTMEVHEHIGTAVTDTDFKSSADDIIAEDEQTVLVKSSESPKVLRKSKIKEKQPVLQTEEDRAEYDRHLEDIRILTEELGGMQRSLPAEKDNGVINLEQRDEAAVKDKEGRLYLFQFPPLLPPLVDNIKKEEADDMVQASPAITAAVPLIDLTQPDNEIDIIIKAEEGLPVAHQSKPQLVMEEGSIGKLVVRKSGKVELDWGGTILKLGRGVETNFLTTTIIIHSLSQQLHEEADGLGSKRQSDVMTGTGTGMGKVMGKFVATPDFSQMLELD